MENPVKMRHIALLFVIVFSLFPKDATAQSTSDQVWVQIEARPTYADALDRASGFDRILADVNGFALRSGWYAIALGPYTRADAEEVLRAYGVQGYIPEDSFIAQTDIYTQQFWPPGQDILGQGTVSPIGLTTQGWGM